MLHRSTLPRLALAVSLTLSLAAGAALPGQVPLVASAGAAGDLFGAGPSVGLTAGLDTGGTGVALDGDVAVVGALGASPYGQWHRGAATVFRRTGSGWVEEQQLEADSSGEAGDQFGAAVAVHGDLIVIGAPRDGVAAVLEAGTAWVFRYDGTSWVQEQCLQADTPGLFERFGSSVAVYDDVIAVGVPHAVVSGLPDEGAVDMFRFVGGAWIREQRVTATGTQFGGKLGSGVALGHDLLLAGMPSDDGSNGSARVFRHAQGDWQLDQVLVPSAEARGGFGFALALSDDALLIGSPVANGNSGAAVVYREALGVWTEEQVLVADVSAGALLGTAVAVQGDRVLLGAPLDDATGVFDRGSVHAFRRAPGGSWSLATALPNDAGHNDAFGSSVAVGEHVALVGVPRQDVAGAFEQGLVMAIDLGAFADYGGALAGSAGEPQLAVQGDLSAGSLVTLRLEQAAPFAQAGLFVGASALPQPFKGGTLVPAPGVGPLLHVTDAAGEVELAFVMPTGVPSQFSYWMQWAVSDGAAQQGVSLSQAVLGIAP